MRGGVDAHARDPDVVVTVPADPIPVGRGVAQLSCATERFVKDFCALLWKSYVVKSTVRVPPVRMLDVKAL